MKIPYLIASTVLLLAGVTAPALAQPADGTSAILAQRLRAGDRVWVETHNMMQSGRVLDLARGILTVDDDGRKVPIPVDRIVSIQRKRNGVLLGTVIGAGVGFACGLPWASLAANEGDSGAGAVIFLTAVGAGAGAGLDALMSVRRTVYQRGDTRIRIHPVIGPERVGVFVSKRF